MVKSSQYLNFDDTIKEVKNFYNKIDMLKNFDENKKKQFFDEKKKTLEKFLEIIMQNDLSDLPYVQVHHSLFGVFYELLIKFCILKEDWENYIENYEGGNKNFEYAKNKLLKILKDKNFNFSEKQIKRIKKILDFIQIQRNNFVHSLFKEMSYLVIEPQLYELIIILDDAFKIDINDKLLSKMLDEILIHKKDYMGMDYEEVFEKEINKKERNKQ